MSTAQTCQSNDLSEKIREGSVLYPDDSIVAHPVALKFRDVPGHWESLKESLRIHGQLAEATVCFVDGKPLLCDGNTRRRLLAEDGQPLRYRVLEASELGNKTVEEWILEKNLNGSTARNLTDTQRALQAADFEQEIRKSAKDRMKSGKAAADGEAGRTEELLARLAGCKSTRVRYALELKGKADRSLVEAVWAGSISLSRARAIAALPDDDNRRAATAAAKAGDKSKLKTLLYGTLLDGERQPIPQTLLDVFGEAALTDEACKHIDRALDLLRQMTTPQIDLNKLRLFANLLQDQKPYCVCPYCVGTRDDCHVCENNRWLTVVRYETVRNDDIARRRNRP